MLCSDATPTGLLPIQVDHQHSIIKRLEPLKKYYACGNVESQTTLEQDWLHCTRQFDAGTACNPPAESPSDSPNHPCFNSDLQITALNVIADDGISYLLPYAQFLHAERVPNPTLEKMPEAPPEKMNICFASAEVILLGSGLKAVERMIQKSSSATPISQ